MYVKHDIRRTYSFFFFAFIFLLNTVVEGTVERRQFELTSLTQLREDVKKNTDQVLRDTFKDSIFVGCVSENHCLIQYGTRLYIFRMERVAEEFFYQRFLDEFGNCGVICLSVANTRCDTVVFHSSNLFCLYRTLHLYTILLLWRWTKKKMNGDRRTDLRTIWRIWPVNYWDPNQRC